MVKKLPANAGEAGDTVSIPGSGRSPAGGNGNPLQYSWLGSSMDRGAWRDYSLYSCEESDTTEHICTPVFYIGVDSNFFLVVTFILE